MRSQDHSISPDGETDLFRDETDAEQVLGNIGDAFAPARAAVYRPQNGPPVTDYPSFLPVDKECRIQICLRVRKHREPVSAGVIGQPYLAVRTDCYADLVT